MATAPVSRSLSNLVLEGPVASAGSARPVTQREAQARLLLLSRDTDVVDVVRNAAQSVAQVAHARDLGDAARSHPDLDPGVVIVASMASDIAALIATVARRYPRALLVAVGTREEGSELMQLAAAGRIFRFLLLPLSFGPVRLTLASAVTQHLERKAVDRRPDVAPSGPTQERRSLISYLAVTAAVLASIGGLWFVSRMIVTKLPAPAASAVPIAAPTQVAVDPTAKLLARAAEALAQGNYLEPSSEAALDLYRAVLALDESNVAAQEGIRTIAEQFVQRAEQALIAEDLDAADGALAQARLVDAAYPRLGFLDTQLERERERRSLSQRRATAQRVGVLMEEVRGEMRAGNLIGSKTGGALGPLLEARRLDPNNPMVVQSVRELNAAIADAVRLALTAGDTQRAQAFANASRRLGAGGQLLAAVERAVAENARRTASLAPPVAPAEAPPPVVEAVQPRSVVSGSTLVVPQASDDEVLQAADLPRTRQVLPTYPRGAALDGTEGYVDVDFVIATDGVPRNLKVRDAVPKRVFDTAAIACLRQWRFEPITQNGAPVSKRATLRLRFQLK